MNKILGDLLPEDIYADFDPTLYPDDASGWDGDNPIFAKLLTRYMPRVIIEVGTWKGQSAFTMAEGCAKRGLDTAIICVDTWLGSEEHWTTWPKELRRKNGYPSVYYQFLANVVRRELCETIVPLATTSTAAAALLKAKSIKADMIYIDANHQYDAVISDIENYFPLVKKGGLLFGHDFQFTEVRWAVEHFSVTRDAPLQTVDAFWLIQK